MPVVFSGMHILSFIIVTDTVCYHGVCYRGLCCMLLQIKDPLNLGACEPQKERGEESICKLYPSTNGTCAEPDISGLCEPASKCIKTSDNTV